MSTINRNFTFSLETPDNSSFNQDNFYAFANCYLQKINFTASTCSPNCTVILYISNTFLSDCDITNAISTGNLSNLSSPSCSIFYSISFKGTTKFSQIVLPSVLIPYYASISVILIPDDATSIVSATNVSLTFTLNIPSVVTTLPPYPPTVEVFGLYRNAIATAYGDRQLGYFDQNLTGVDSKRQYLQRIDYTASDWSNNCTLVLWIANTSLTSCSEDDYTALALGSNVLSKTCSSFYNKTFRGTSFSSKCFVIK